MKQKAKTKLQTRGLETMLQIPLHYIVGPMVDRGIVEWDTGTPAVGSDDLRLTLNLSGGTVFIVESKDVLCVSEDGKHLDVCRYVVRDED